jgi:translation initiation factor 1
MSFCMVKKPLNLFKNWIFDKYARSEFNSGQIFLTDKLLTVIKPSCYVFFHHFVHNSPSFSYFCKKVSRMDNDWKKRLGVVYSTNENYHYSEEGKEEETTLPPEKQRLTVSLDKKNRKGKAVTLISGFTGTADDLKELGKHLKSKCGVGGSVKDMDILLQGDHRNKVIQLLQDENYHVKKSGG